MLLNLRLRPNNAVNDSSAVNDDEAAEVTGVANPAELAWLDRVVEVLDFIGAKPGFLRGWVGRSPDEPGEYLLAAEFDSAGNLRRALGASDLRPMLWPLLAESQPEPESGGHSGASTYEVLARALPGGGVERLLSDLAPDAGDVRLGHLPNPHLEG